MTLTVETWCEALESGKYKQADGQLRAGDAFCCLGVACDLSGTGDWEGDAYHTVTYGLDDFTLPFPVREMLALATSTGDFEFSTLPSDLQTSIAQIAEANGRSGEIDGPPSDLAGLNDYSVPFPLIAKVIRARPKGLFREEPES